MRCALGEVVRPGQRRTLQADGQKTAEEPPGVSIRNGQVDDEALTGVITGRRTRDKLRPSPINFLNGLDPLRVWPDRKFPSKFLSVWPDKSEEHHRAGMTG